MNAYLSGYISSVPVLESFILEPSALPFYSPIDPESLDSKKKYQFHSLISKEYHKFTSHPRCEVQTYNRQSPCLYLYNGIQFRTKLSTSRGAILWRKEICSCLKHRQLIVLSAVNIYHTCAIPFLSSVRNKLE